MPGLLRALLAALLRLYLHVRTLPLLLHVFPPRRSHGMRVQTHIFNLTRRDPGLLARRFRAAARAMDGEMEKGDVVPPENTPLLPVSSEAVSRPRGAMKGEMPSVGLGCDRGVGEAHVAHALTKGQYRFLDTAAGYFTERLVAKGIRRAAKLGVPRGEVFVQTKVNPLEFGYTRTHEALQRQVEFLGLSYVDSVLLHEPGPSLEARVGSWRALEQWHAKGVVHRIGVANFGVRLLTEMLPFCVVKPAFLQVEFHPLCHATQARLVDFCREHGIQMQAYSPLGKGKLVAEAPEIAEVAKRHGVAPAQVVLKWILQKGVVPVCRSEHPVRMLQNNSLGNFHLDTADMAAIDDIETRLGPRRFSGVWTKDHDELRK